MKNWVLFLVLGLVSIGILSNQFVTAQSVEEYILKGHDFYHNYKFDKAFMEYEKALLIDPDNKDALYAEGLVFEYKYYYQRALDRYEKILSKDPNNIKVLERNAIVLIDLKRFNDAINIYDKILQHDPQNEEIVKNRQNLLDENYTFLDDTGLGRPFVSSRMEEENTSFDFVLDEPSEIIPYIVGSGFGMMLLYYFTKRKVNSATRAYVDHNITVPAFVAQKYRLRDEGFVNFLVLFFDDRIIFANSETLQKIDTTKMTYDEILQLDGYNFELLYDSIVEVKIKKTWLKKYGVVGYYYSGTNRPSEGYMKIITSQNKFKMNIGFSESLESCEDILRSFLQDKVKK